MLLSRYLDDLWNRQIYYPGDPANCTGCLLISAEFCTQAHKALRVYEDFSALLGAPSWNPARKIAPHQIPNPARAVLGQFDIHDLDQLITDDQLVELETALRQAIGSDVPLTQEEVFDAIAYADAPIRAWSSVLPELRSLLEPAIAESVTDDDLRSAGTALSSP